MVTYTVFLLNGGRVGLQCYTREDGWVHLWNSRVRGSGCVMSVVCVGGWIGYVKHICY